MDWIIWLVVIVAIVAIVWWLLNRNSSRGGNGSAGNGTAASREAAPTQGHDAGHESTHRGALSGGGSASSAAAAGVAGMPTAAGFGQAEPPAEPEPEASRGSAAGGNDKTPEWETQWSETPPAGPQADVHQKPAPTEGRDSRDSHGSHTVAAAGSGAAAAGAPVHHPEYTEPHAPTLPGAESAAAELEHEAGSGAERATGTTGEPAGHLAVDQPYGEGSAAPEPDGSGPEGFAVKGVASSMVYYDETSPGFEETRAEVWFQSEAHAEAAGFRPPRRTRR